MFVSKRINIVKDELQFYIDGQQTPTVNGYLHLGHTVVFKLLRSYCSDFYGSVLWDMCLSTVESVCTAWRKGLMRV